MSLTVVGCMSGTSYDAVDAAVVRLDADGDVLRLSPLGAVSEPVPPDLRRAIAGLLPPGTTTIEAVCRVHTEVGRLTGDVAARAVRDAGAADLVVSHGQTVFHWIEDGRARGTLQLGAPGWIAAATGLPVVSDLRTADVAAGGQGAPLVTLFDALLLLAGDDGGRRGALNLGGIANVTVHGPRGPLAYDLGPANALLDAVVADRTGGAETMDTDGARAARGRVRADLLARCLDEPYFARPAPKSTGRELFHLGWVRDRQGGLPAMTDDDLLATLTELTAVLVERACRDANLRELVVAGGGIRNPVLAARLRDRCAPTELTPMDRYGVAAQAKEATAFALLGWFAWHGLAANVPSATGADAPVVLGSVTPGARPLRLPAPSPVPPRRLVITA